VVALAAEPLIASASGRTTHPLATRPGPTLRPRGALKGEPMSEVESDRCPGCGKPFESPDHDPRCSSCAEAGMLEEPPPPGATNCPHCARMLKEICRLSYELGKAQGELEASRWLKG